MNAAFNILAVETSCLLTESEMKNSKSVKKEKFFSLDLPPKRSENFGITKKCKSIKVTSQHPGWVEKGFSAQWHMVPGATYKGQWQGNQRHGLGLGYPDKTWRIKNRKESMYQNLSFFDGMCDLGVLG